MALAAFFDKAALSAATSLRGFNRAAFEAKLNAVNIGIVFDADADMDPEQVVGLELLVNLLARLYPTLSLICSDSAPVLERLRTVALGINPEIEIQAGCEGVTMAVATNDSSQLGCIRGKVPIVYIGASGWIAKVNTVAPVGWEKVAILSVPRLQRASRHPTFSVTYLVTSYLMPNWTGICRLISSITPRIQPAISNPPWVRLI